MPFVFNPPPCPPKCATKPSSEYDAFITRGTTPTFSFTLPEELTESTINDLCLAFNQDNSGNVVASQIYKALVQKILCDEVL